MINHGRKYRCEEEYYDEITRLCAALINIHIERSLLRAQDGSFFRKYKIKIYTKGVKGVEKRRISQENY